MTKRDQATLPRSWDLTKLMLGEAVTPCCGAHVSIFTDNGTVYCKGCYEEVN